MSSDSERQIGPTTDAQGHDADLDGRQYTDTFSADEMRRLNKRFGRITQPGQAASPDWATDPGVFMRRLRGDTTPEPSADSDVADYDYQPQYDYDV